VRAKEGAGRTEEDEAPEGAGEGGVGDAADGEVEAGVPLGVQVVPRRDPGPGGRGGGRLRLVEGLERGSRVEGLERGSRVDGLERGSRVEG
jgi:hypothetical protein